MRHFFSLSLHIAYDEGFRWGLEGALKSARPATSLLDIQISHGFSPIICPQSVAACLTYRRTAISALASVGAETHFRSPTDLPAACISCLYAAADFPRVVFYDLSTDNDRAPNVQTHRRFYSDICKRGATGPPLYRFSRGLVPKICPHARNDRRRP